MKYIIMIGIIFGVTGCQAPPPSIEKLNSLSNEDLCRALGTYNNNATLVLTIHDELKKRPKKINAERCFALEKIESESTSEAIGNTSELESNKVHIKKAMREYQYTEDPRNKHINAYYNRLAPPGELRLGVNSNLHTTEVFNSISSSAEINDMFPSKIERHKEIDMSEKDMGELMRSCLQKHLSKSRINTSDNK